MDRTESIEGSLRVISYCLIIMCIMEVGDWLGYLMAEFILVFL